MVITIWLVLPPTTSNEQCFICFFGLSTRARTNHFLQFEKSYFLEMKIFFQVKKNHCEHRNLLFCELSSPTSTFLVGRSYLRIRIHWSLYTCFYFQLNVVFSHRAGTLPKNKNYQNISIRTQKLQLTLHTAAQSLKLYRNILNITCF